MGEVVGLKYRAFLSYAHKDAAWARWLHRSLEGFRIDKDLSARPGVGKSLRPIFKDREEFTGGHTLGEATVAALDQSAALIVLCSTIAAGRPAVNEEVRVFRSRHPGRPVIPVIVEGSAPGNFPPALRFALDAAGQVTTQEITFLGPDLRDAADGKSLGLAKVVAGLTGLAADDIYRRAERARRQQSRVRMAIAGVFLAVAAGGGFFAWQNHQKQQTLSEIEALVARYSPVSSAEAAPGAGQGLAEAITAIAQGAATDPRYREALDLLKAGKPKEAEPLLAAVAADKKKRAATESKEAADAYRNLAAIKAVSDPRSAREAYAEAAKLDPDHVEGMIRHCWFQMEAGNLAEAESACRRVVAIGKAGTDDRNLYWARLVLGDIESARGDLVRARATYDEARAIAQRLADADKGNAGWQRDLMTSHWNLAAAGDEPRRHFEEVVRILRDMNARGILAPVDEKWLPMAEEELAKLAP